MRLCSLLLLALLCAFKPVGADVPASIYDYQVAARNGSTINFADFKGKKILIVNIPIDNDYDQQYAQLEALYKKYQGKLVIVAFLADNFAVAPGSKPNHYIANRDYKLSCPIAAKLMLRGDNMAPIYQWLTNKAYNHYSTTEVKWNFQKYLINEQGNLIAVFDPKIPASDAKVVAAVEQ